MLRSIVAAIVSALRAFGLLAGRAAVAPFRMLDGMLGGGASSASPVPEVSAEAEDVPAPAQDHKHLYEQIALAVMQWCCNSLVAGEQVPIPPKMPRKIAAWLPGLTRDECIALGCANRIAISAHLRSYELVPGVRSVQSLERLEWPPEPRLGPDQGSGGFLNALVGAGTAPCPVAGSAL